MVHKFHGKTTMQVVKVSFQWEIEHFWHRSEELGEKIISPTFPISPGSFKWTLDVYPKGRTDPFKQYVAVYLKLQATVYSKVAVQLAISIVDRKSGKRNTKIGHKIFKMGQSCGWDNFVDRRLLLDEARKLLPNNKLTLLCQVQVYCNNSDIQLQSIKDHTDQDLSHSLRKLLDYGYFSDATISVGGQNFRVHRSILSVRSPVLSAMFRSQRNGSNHYEIDEIDKEIFEKVLQFAYTGRADNLTEMTAVDLLSAANKLDMRLLKIICQQVLVNCLNVDNSCYYLILSDLYDAGDLKKNVTSFLLRNSDAVTKTAGWTFMNASHPVLADDIIAKLAKLDVNICK